MVNSTEIAQTLLKKGLSINACAGQEGNTCLHFACEDVNDEMIRFLLENSADPNIKNKEGKLPLQMVQNFDARSKVDKLIKSLTEI